MAAGRATQPGAIKEKQVGQGTCVGIGETNEGAKIGDIIIGTQAIRIGGRGIGKNQRIQTGDDCRGVGLS